jgi:hypothetical protein
MEFDEWNHEQFDEWQRPLDMPAASSVPAFSHLEARFGATARPSEKFPEVIIGSSSDEDAPPVPESTQLARENLQLRARVNALVSEAKNLEQANDSLKGQLNKYRTTFTSQMKTKFMSLFK